VSQRPSLDPKQPSRHLYRLGVAACEDCSRILYDSLATPRQPNGFVAVGVTTVPGSRPAVFWQAVAGLLRDGTTIAQGPTFIRNANVMTLERMHGGCKALPCLTLTWYRGKLRGPLRSAAYAVGSLPSGHLPLLSPPIPEPFGTLVILPLRQWAGASAQIDQTRF